MGFVRAWWTSVVVGVVVALLGIGGAEVAGMPAGSDPLPARTSAGAGPGHTVVEPAAIESDDEVTGPAPAPAFTPEVTSRPRPEKAPRAKSEPVRARPAPTRRRHTPILRAMPTSVPTPVATPSPLPRVAPIVPTKPVPMRPAQVLDLRRWKLTLPVGRQGHPTEFRQPVLGSLASGSFIRLTPDHGVAFRAPVGGATTGHSSYPRSELREMSADGRHEAGWTNATGRHLMTITQAITATPRVKPHVVAGQIHDADDDVVMIRLEGERLFVESDGTDVGLLDPHYRLGTRFTVSIIATRRGIGVVYNGHRSIHLHDVGHGWYFKAGCYPQSNPDRGDRPTAYGEVVIYALTVQHRGTSRVRGTSSVTRTVRAGPGRGRPALR